MNIVYLSVGLVIGVFIGIVVFKLAQRSTISGVLRVDTSDPDDQPYLFLELSERPLTIKEKKYVTFEVNPQDYIPHN